MKISRRVVGPVVLVVLLFSGMLVYNAPARLMQPILQAAVPQLMVSGLTGSLWDGAASQSWFNHNGRLLALGKLEWDLKAWSLLILSPRVEVNLQGPAIQLSGELETLITGTVKGRDITITLPLAVLRTWYPLLLDGQLNLELQRIAYRDNWLRNLNGTAVLAAANWQMGSEIISLGDYQGKLGLEGSQLIIDLQDRDAALAVTGQGALSPGGAYSVDLNVAQRNADVAPIYQFIQFFGKPEGDGLRLKMNGNTPGRERSP